MNAVVDIKKGLEGVVTARRFPGRWRALGHRGIPSKNREKPSAAVAHLVVFGELPDARAATRGISGKPGGCPRWPTLCSFALRGIRWPLCSRHALMAVEAPFAGRTDRR